MKTWRVMKTETVTIKHIFETEAETEIQAVENVRKRRARFVAAMRDPHKNEEMLARPVSWNEPLVVRDV